MDLSPELITAAITAFGGFGGAMATIAHGHRKLINGLTDECKSLRAECKALRAENVAIRIELEKCQRGRVEDELDHVHERHELERTRDEAIGTALDVRLDLEDAERRRDSSIPRIPQERVPRQVVKTPPARPALTEALRAVSRGEIEEES